MLFAVITLGDNFDPRPGSKKGHPGSRQGHPNKLPEIALSPTSLQIQ